MPALRHSTSLDQLSPARPCRLAHMLAGAHETDNDVIGTVTSGRTVVMGRDGTGRRLHVVEASPPEADQPSASTAWVNASNASSPNRTNRASVTSVGVDATVSTAIRAASSIGQP